MDFFEVVGQVLDLLQRQGRVSYRALKRQFDVDDDYIEDLKEEIIEAQRLAVDENNRILVWVGEAASDTPPVASVSPSAPSPAMAQESAPLSYTPQYLAEKILTSRSVLEGEHKHVTVLFADIKDSTELIKDLDPEAAQQLLDPAIHIMMEAVHRYEGTVNQVLGDGIMALFGASIAHEDHALRACYATLAIQAAMQPYADEVQRSHGITMRIRVGLNSGEVVVRAIGNDLHMDYSAVGKTTHLAARMEQLETPGSITLTAATLRLVEGLVRVNALGPVPVKSMSEPVEVFALAGASAIRRRLQASVARGLTRFVGRETEMQALAQALTQAGAGHGQVVAAVGEAGVGKSRLVYELVQSHRTQGWLVLESASVSYGKATPYFPVVDLLKHYIHYRPEYQHGWGSKAYYTQLRLDPLPPESADAFLQALLGDDPSLEALKQLLIERTEGNPFFLEESVRTLVETQELVGEPGAYCLVQKLLSIQVPPTVQAVLAARIDRLPAEEKRLLQTAAVIGTEVHLPLLQTITDCSEDAFHRGLAHLQTAEFLYETRLFPDREYTFKHALTQNVAYQSLLMSTRQQVHQRIAQTLATHFPDTVAVQPELLAHHYTEAELPEHAIPYWHQAGQRANERSAHVEAVSHLTKGLELLTTLPHTPERTQHELTLQIALASALVATKGMTAPEVEQAYARAHELCRQVGEPSELFPALFGLWRLYTVRAEFQTARELGEQFVTLAQRQEDTSLIVQAHFMLGVTLFWLQEMVSAREYLERAMALYDPRQHRSLAFLYGQDPGVFSRLFAAVALWWLGYPDQALQRSDEALALAREIAHPYSLASALVFAAWVHQLRRESQAAQDRAEAAMAQSTEQGFPFWLAHGALRRGWALAMQGQGAEGIAQIQQGLAAHQAQGPQAGRPYSLALLAETYGNAGQIEEGLATLAEALTLVDTTGDRLWEAELYRLKGTLLLQQAEPDEQQVEICFRQALDLARDQQAKSWELRAAMSLARLWQKQGKREKARQLLAGIYGWFTEGFDTPDLQEAKALLDELAEDRS